MSCFRLHGVAKRLHKHTLVLETGAHMELHPFNEQEIEWLLEYMYHWHRLDVKELLKLGGFS